LIGGTVALESAPGAGTALRVDMPLAGELAPADTVVAELIAQWNARVRLADRVTRVGQAVRAFAWPAYMLAIWLGVYTIAQLGPAYSAWREPALWLLEAGWLVLFAQLAIEVALAAADYDTECCQPPWKSRTRSLNASGTAIVRPAA
jgi:hypothetical protein